MTHGINRARYAVYVLAYVVPFIFVFLNFALTVWHVDLQQEHNDPEGE